MGARQKATANRPAEPLPVLVEAQEQPLSAIHRRQAKRYEKRVEGGGGVEGKGVNAECAAESLPVRVEAQEQPLSAIHRCQTKR